MSHLVKRGNREYQVFVEAVESGGFTYFVIDRDLSGPTTTETRHESRLCFDTEHMAYQGGIANARKRARANVVRH